MGATAVDRAYAEIRRGIVAGDYPPGHHLTAAILAGKLGLSRTPVRESLRRLHAEGLVTLQPHQGAFVTGWSEADLDDLFSLRAVLESHGAALAAARIRPDGVAALKDLAHGMEAAAAAKPPGYLDRVAEKNDAFHKLILEAAASGRLKRVLAGVIEVPLVLSTFRRYDEASLQRSMGHHRELIAAFEARDPEWARSAMRCHVQAARSAFRRHGREPGACGGPSLASATAEAVAA